MKIFQFKAKLIGNLLLSFILLSFHSFADNSVLLKSLTNVTKITQDKQGFIWLAGQQGLTRLDDSSHVTFSLNNTHWPQAFSWVHDSTLIDNNLLLATESHGLWLFNTDTGKSERLLVDIENNSHYHAVIFNNKYYINAPNNFYQYDPIKQSTSLIANNILIKEVAQTNNNLYVANSNGLFKLEQQSLIKIIDKPIKALASFNDTLIAITDSNIYRFYDNGELHTVAPNKTIYAATKANTKGYFFTIDNQGIVDKYNSKSLFTVPHYYSQSKAVRARSLFQDISGVLWVTSSSGIEQLTENYLSNHEVTFDIPINANEITLFDNEIIIGSYGAGLQNFLVPVFNTSVNNYFSEQGLIIFDVLAINDALYIATRDGLWRYHKKDKQLVKLDYIDNQLILKLEYKNNKLYMATNYNGLYIYDLNRNEVVAQLDEKQGLSHNEVIDVLPLDSGNVWLASSDNINIYHPFTQKVQHVDSPNKTKIISLVEIDNKIFASTLGDGILVFNHSGELIKQIAAGQSFTEMLVVNDTIWLSGKPGLYRLSPQSYQLTMIANTQEYSFVSSMVVKDNTLYAAHYSGILAFNLSEQEQFNPRVTISKTTVSGQSYLLNKSINITNKNDVITLELSSLDHRLGLAKKYQYKIKNSPWQKMNNNQLTLTGLASGNYPIEIKATNSLGQWSSNRAFTEINVAYPWYWSKEMRVVYGVSLFLIILLTAWLLYLRTKSIQHIHTLLKSEMRNCGKTIKTVQRNLELAIDAFEQNELEDSKKLIAQSLEELNENISKQEPDDLDGKPLTLAIPFFANYLYAKYQVKLQYVLGDNIDNFSYAIRADIYKIIFEALTSALFNHKAISFQLTLKEVNHKLWLTIDSDNDSFHQLDSKVKFNLSNYTIRQITNKLNASLNTFQNEDGSSQLVISFPLMQLN